MSGGVVIRSVVAATVLVLLLTVAVACDGSEAVPPSVEAVIDSSPGVEVDGADVSEAALPQFVTVPVHDPAAIERISRFRSGVGHDYSDGHESCRSMKHYFAPPDDADWSELEIRAPFDGRAVGVESEWAGDKVELVADALEATAFRLTIFHVVPDPGVEVGRAVSAGERLGRHVGGQTMSDVAVWNVPSGESRRLVSYFDVLDERVFEEYRAVGVSSREGMVIGKAERDAVPLECGVEGEFVRGEGQAEGGRPEDWVRLSR